MEEFVLLPVKSKESNAVIAVLLQVERVVSYSFFLSLNIKYLANKQNTRNIWKKKIDIDNFKSSG